MDENIYDQFGDFIDRKLVGVRAEAQRRAAVGPPPLATFKLWQEKEGPPIGVEEVGSDEEVTQGLREGGKREEPIIIESDDEDKEEKMKPPSALLGKIEDLLSKMGRYQQKLVDLCEGIREWGSNVPKVFLDDSDPESAPGRPGVNVVGSGPRTGMMMGPLTPQTRLAQAARTRSQAKACASKEPPRREPEPGGRKEAVEVEDDDDEEEEDKKLRQEEDKRAEQRAKKREAREGAEPVLPDVPPKKKKYAVRLEEGFDVEKVIDRLLEGHNDLMTLKEILASAPKLRDGLKGRLSRCLVPNVHLGTILPKEAEWAESGTKMDWKCVACGTVDSVVKGSKCAAMTDTGAETRKADAIRFGLDIDRSDCGILHGASCKAVFYGTASNVFIEVGKVKVRACFFVMPDVDDGILLGRSFLSRTEMVIFNKHDGTLILLLCDPACGNYEVITCRNTGPKSIRNRPNPGSFTIEESEDERQRLRAEPEEEERIEAFSLSLSDVGKTMDLVAAHEMAKPDAIQTLRAQEKPGDNAGAICESAFFLGRLKQGSQRRCKTVDQKCRSVPVLVTEDEEVYYERERGLIRRMKEKASARPCRIKEGNGEKLIIGEPDFLLPHERALMVELIKKRHRAYAFSDEECDRLDVDKIPMIHIHTVPHELWNLKGAQYANPDEEKKVVDYLDGKIRTHIADYSSGPYVSPWFCFIEPNGTLRWVQDPQRLNAVTVRDEGGLPNADALSESCVGSPIISLIDLYSGYDQFPVYPPDRPVTAMHTPRGLIHMNVAPQGWTNGVAMVQRAMIRVMQSVSPHITQPYIDDLAVKGSRVKESDEILPGEEVVARMKEEFREGGLVLGAPDYDVTETRSFIVETDVGPTALGEVLIQADMEGKERPLRFESRTLCTTERNYSQFKRETLAVLHCLRIFRNYIFGMRFILRLDPTALAYSHRNYVPSDPTVAKWLTYIWMFNFELERIPGSKNRADGLSRINWDSQEGEAVKNTPPVDGFLNQEEDVRLHINKWSSQVLRCVGHPIWQAPSGYERKAELVVKPFEEEDPWGGKDVHWMMKLALAGSYSLVEDMKAIEEGPGQVERHGSLDQEGSLNPAGNEGEVRESQDDEFEEGEIKEVFRAEEYEGIYLELGLLLSCEMRLRDASDRAQRMMQCYLVRDGQLFVRREVWNPRRVVCSRNRQIDVIAALHDGIAGGHREERSRLRQGEPLHPRLEREVGVAVHLDLLFMPLGDQGYNYIFDARNNVSGFVDGRAIRTKTGPILVSCIEEYYLRYPFVREFVMDMGSEFTCQDVQELLSRSDFTKTTMLRGGKGTRPPRRPLGASGGYERHGPRHRESTPMYDDGDIELFLDSFWEYARSMGWTVAQAIERLRGAGRFEEPIARIRREATTRPEVEMRMQEHLAAHALEHPDLEEPTPAEPRQEPCQPEKEVEAEIPKRIDHRTRERAPAGETTEEKRARGSRRIEEIWQERQRLEAAGALPEQQQERQRLKAAGALLDQPPSALAKAPEIQEMWRDFWEQRGEGLPSPTRAGFGVARKAEERLDRKIKFLPKTTFD
ncbi:hypothetical protein CBR_g30021 [Chara braunii]|uniref:RNA-directed DNA polymerase n=1 Tax=Chara braunii TaxID=69332 RepID=A0A388LBQ1_CHABU|nr:hypothetical protein CBR_g30021 [Chara braunii]|eukprot:GBG79757.1 hypothetical protein CBR_g30021 [Chara braunii]